MESETTIGFERVWKISDGFDGGPDLNSTAVKLKETVGQRFCERARRKPRHRLRGRGSLMGTKALAWWPLLPTAHLAAVVQRSSSKKEAVSAAIGRP
jgi:hypothetical protein